jgi:hypothetical protein
MDVREYDYISRRLLQLLEYNYIILWPHQLIVDYFIYLSRLVSTSKLVENGFHAIDN